ncbi:hypothetical protein P692DRAFT_20235394 [Suillus brevipes Sb2]|nr:hypothetical protein P692DRAFT_20235394 [Suillus brevipes Sb2]
MLCHPPHLSRVSAHHPRTYYAFPNHSLPFVHNKPRQPSDHPPTFLPFPDLQNRHRRVSTAHHLYASGCFLRSNFKVPPRSMTIGSYLPTPAESVSSGGQYMSGRACPPSFDASRPHRPTDVRPQPVAYRHQVHRRAIQAADAHGGLGPSHITGGRLISYTALQ